MKEYFDKNPESIPFLDRLEQEWKMHGKIIIACDYDDTISPWKMNNNNFKRVFQVLNTAKATGAYIVIFTACKTDRYEEITKYCLDNGLEIDGINKTPIDLPYGNDSKIYANIFIDDRAGLNEALNILEMAMYRIRGSKQNNNLDF
jgi:thiol-disulfide isomerase/thioredoxin